jgi:hypothetical protein
VGPGREEEADAWDCTMWLNGSAIDRSGSQVRLDWKEMVLNIYLILSNTHRKGNNSEKIVRLLRKIYHEVD